MGIGKTSIVQNECLCFRLIRTAMIESVSPFSERGRGVPQRLEESFHWLCYMPTDVAKPRKSCLDYGLQQASQSQGKEAVNF